MTCVYMKGHERTWVFPRRGWGVPWGVVGMRQEKVDGAQDEKDPRGQNEGLGVSLPGGREKLRPGYRQRCVSERRPLVDIAERGWEGAGWQQPGQDR